MSKPASAPRELCPEGTHAAVCTGVIDYGTQIVEFQGNEKKQKKISKEKFILLPSLSTWNG